MTMRELEELWANFYKESWNKITINWFKKLQQEWRVIRFLARMNQQYQIRKFESTMLNKKQKLSENIHEQETHYYKRKVALEEEENERIRKRSNRDSSDPDDSDYSSESSMMIPLSIAMRIITPTMILIIVIEEDDRSANRI